MLYIYNIIEYICVYIFLCMYIYMYEGNFFKFMKVKEKKYLLTCFQK